MGKWQTVKRLILEDITCSSEGSTLRTDQEFASAATCSLQPVRRAMEELVHDGLIERRRGKPAVVRMRPPRIRESQLGFTSTATKQYGKAVRTQVWDAQTRGPHSSEEDAFEKSALKILGLKRNEPFFVVV